MKDEILSREELITQLDKCKNEIDLLKTRLNTTEKEKTVITSYLINLKDVCKTYFASNSMSKDEFYNLYKNNTRDKL